jgi:iron complex outermembrane receptor protein
MLLGQRRPARFLALIVMVAGVNGTAQGEEEVGPAAVSAGPLEEMVVTATRYPKGLDSIPANVSVITAEEIENSVARNIPDLLRVEAGLHVTDIAGNRATYTVDIRGFGETAALNTLVLVDGRRINAADLSGTDWTTMPLDRVDRIEIIRGARSSVIYGDNASGGVINILTRQGQDFEAGVELGVGSYQGRDASAYIRGSEGRLNYALSGGSQRSDGYRENSATRFDSLGADFRYSPSPLLQLSLSGGYTNNHTRLPGALTSAQIANLGRRDSQTPDDFADTEDYYVMGGAEIRISDNSRFKAEASLRNRESLAVFPTFFYRGETDLETVIFSPQFILDEEVLGFENHLTFGFDYSDDHSRIVDNFADANLVILEKKNYGYFIYEEFVPWEGVFLSAGYRYDRARFSIDSSLHDEEEVLDENLYTAGLSYRVDSNLDAYFSFSRGFRFSVLDELYNIYCGPGFVFCPNGPVNLLRPQSSQDYELGIRYWHGERSGLNLNFFQIDTRDEIFRDPATFSNANLDGETRRRGVEIVLYSGFEYLDFRVGYVYTDAEIISSSSYAGKAVPGVPTHQLTLSGLLSLGHGFSLAADGVYVGRRPFISDFANAFRDQESYFSLNAKLKYEWKQLSIFVDLNNLTDAEYSEYGVVAGGVETFYPSPAFNALVGFALGF